MRRINKQNRAPYDIVSNGVSIDLTGNAPQSEKTVSITSFTAALDSVKSTLLSAASSNRKSVLIQNLSGDTIYVNVGAPAKASPVAGIAVFTGGNYEPYFTPGDAIWAIGTVATEQQIAVMIGS